MSLEFSIGVRLTHFFDFLFLSLLVRSGIEIRSRPLGHERALSLWLIPMMLAR